MHLYWSHKTVFKFWWWLQAILNLKRQAAIVFGKLLVGHKTTNPTTTSRRLSRMNSRVGYTNWLYKAGKPRQYAVCDWLIVFFVAFSAIWKLIGEIVAGRQRCSQSHQVFDDDLIKNDIVALNQKHQKPYDHFCVLFAALARRTRRIMMVAWMRW